jgi:uncharacterized membrane protein
MDEQTILFGVPVPSTDPIFLTFVVIHILIALVCVISGLLAMLTEKTKRQHPSFGKIYFWGMLSAFVTVSVLSVMRWPHNIHLLSIGTLAFAFTYAGRGIARRKRLNWTRMHTICMGASYILLLTGFYVDNGKNLPFWRLFPQWFFFVFPAAIGMPIIMYVLKKHPLNKVK